MSRQQLVLPGVDYEALERGGEDKKRGPTIDAVSVGKMLFCLWILCVKKEWKLIAHRDEFLDLLARCVGDDMPQSLHEVLSDDLLRERMVSGVVRGGLARHVDSGSSGEVCVTITRLDATFLLANFAIDFPAEVKWLREHVTAQ